MATEAQTDYSTSRGSRAAAGAAGGLAALAGIVRLVTSVIVTVIVAAIVLRILDANTSNAIVRDVHDVGSALVGPFKNMFTLHSAKWTMVLDWGIAAAVYALVGGAIASALGRAALTTDPVA